MLYLTLKAVHVACAILSISVSRCAAS